jgi:hypothetical protein
LSPRASSARTSDDPMNPAPPVTKHEEPMRPNVAERPGV